MQLLSAFCSVETIDLEEVRAKAGQWLLDPGFCDENELRGDIQAALRLTEVGKRFRVFHCYELLEKLLKEGKDDLELFRLGLENVLKYAVNVMRFPERKEYQRIKVR